MKFKIFENYKELRYGLSEKKDGSLKAPSAVKEGKLREFLIFNRERFFTDRGIRPDMAIGPYLSHGGNVKRIDGKNYARTSWADGFITDTSGIILTITVADCFPLYFYDPAKKAVGLAHAGWRGITQGIVEHTIEAFKKEFGSDVNTILMGIGPGIQKCHFEVQDDIIGLFEGYSSFITKKEKGYLVDLRGIINAKASSAGIKTLETQTECTFCAAGKYFSYRRDKPKITETMLAYIGKHGI